MKTRNIIITLFIFIIIGIGIAIPIYINTYSVTDSSAFKNLTPQCQYVKACEERGGCEEYCRDYQECIVIDYRSEILSCVIDNTLYLQDYETDELGIVGVQSNTMTANGSVN